MIIGSLLICKVLVQRLLFKPYKIRQYFETTEYLSDETRIKNIPWSKLKHKKHQIGSTETIFWQSCSEEEKERLQQEEKERLE